jgi:hypothetical protein
MSSVMTRECVLPLHPIRELFEKAADQLHRVEEAILARQEEAVMEVILADQELVDRTAQPISRIADSDWKPVVKEG